MTNKREKAHAFRDGLAAAGFARRAPASVALVAVAALGLGACGGDSTPTAPPAPVTTVLAEGSGTAAASSCTATVSGGRLIITCPGPPTEVTLPSFTISGPSRIEFILDWTAATSDMDAVLRRDGAEVGRTNSSSTKPERLALDNMPAGTYTPVVLNYATRQEAFSYQILVTR